MKTCETSFFFYEGENKNDFFLLSFQKSLKKKPSTEIKNEFPPKILNEKNLKKRKHFGVESGVKLFSSQIIKKKKKKLNL